MRSSSVRCRSARRSQGDRRTSCPSSYAPGRGPWEKDRGADDPSLSRLDPDPASSPSIIHLSELHGAATHLAVVAIPLFAILYACRRAGAGGIAVERAEPWALGACVVGVAAAGATGLLVW